MQAWKRSLTVHNIPNLRTVVTSWRYYSRVKWRIDYINDHSQRSEALRHIEVSREIFGTFCGLIISTFKQRNIGKILVGFQGRWTSIYYFSNSQIFYEVLDIFPWLSHQLTLIMLNVGMVDNLKFTYAFHSRVSRRAVLLLFFALSLCIFSFQG